LLQYVCEGDTQLEVPCCDQVRYVAPRPVLRKHKAFSSLATVRAAARSGAAGGV